LKFDLSVRRADVHCNVFIGELQLSLMFMRGVVLLLKNVTIGETKLPALFLARSLHRYGKEAIFDDLDFVLTVICIYFCSLPSIAT
jgi:hypothetical protein